MNLLLLSGKLGKDPETTKIGETSVTKFSVATNEKWFSKSKNENVEETTWHDCECWGKQGENLAKFFQKGKGIVLQGSIKKSTSEKDGKTTYWTTVKVRSWEFPPTSKNEQSSDNRQKKTAPKEPPTFEGNEYF